MKSSVYRCPNCHENFFAPATGATNRVICPHCSHADIASRFVIVGSGSIGSERTHLPERKSGASVRFRKSSREDRGDPAADAAKNPRDKLNELLRRRPSQDDRRAPDSPSRDEPSPQREKTGEPLPDRAPRHGENRGQPAEAARSPSTAREVGFETIDLQARIDADFPIVLVDSSACPTPQQLVHFEPWNNVPRKSRSRVHIENFFMIGLASPLIVLFLILVVRQLMAVL